MTGLAHSVPLDLPVVRRNRLSPRELDRLVEPDLGTALGLVRDRRDSTVKRVEALCERIHDEVPRRQTSRDRGRLLKVRRRLHASCSGHVDIDAVRRALDSLSGEAELADAVADARDDVDALASTHERVRDTIRARLEVVATHVTDLLRREPLASTLAVSSPAFTESLIRGPIPSDPDHRSLRTATAFLKRASMKTSPFGRLTEVAVGHGDGHTPDSATRVVQPRTLSARLLLAAAEELAIAPEGLVQNVIGDGERTRRLAAHRVVVGGIPVRFDEIGARDDVPIEPAEAVRLGLAGPAMTFATSDGADDLRAIKRFLLEHAGSGDRRDTWTDFLDRAAEMVDAMTGADATQRCALIRRFDLQVRRVLPYDTGTRFFEHPGAHCAQLTTGTEIATAVGDLASQAIVVDAEYPRLARFLTRVRDRGGRDLRLDEALAEYLDTMGQTRARDTVDCAQFSSHLRATGTAPAPTLAAAITTTFVQTAAAGFVVNAQHTSGIGLIARHVSGRSRASETLAAFVRSTAPGAEVHQFTCWDDWLSTQAVGVAGVPALRLPGDLTAPGDDRRALSDFVVTVDPGGTIDVRCADTLRPAAFCYTGVVPYPLLSGFARLLALISTPWLARRDPTRPAVGEVVRGRRTLPCDSARGALLTPDAIDTAIATTDWLADAGVGEEFFATIVSVDGTRSKPQWYSQLSPTCLTDVAKAVDSPDSSAIEIVDCFPARADEPATEFALAHRVEVIR